MNPVLAVLIQFLA